jgi:hypothetical protein
VRIVLANNSIAGYPQGGGHWSCFLQYLFGLNALGHDVFWLEVLQSTGNPVRDHRLIDIFFGRFKRYGFKDRCALLLYDHHVEEPTLELAHAFGMSKHRIREIARSTDLLWNFACSLRQPLLSLFSWRVLIDGDPGHLQVSALTWEMGIRDHHAFLSAGTKLQDPDCKVPTLGVKWHPFIQFIYLPMWDVAPDPGPDAPYTSVTQWSWEELELEGRRLSISKREAYLSYVNLPQRTRRPFELAANIDRHDTTDRELITNEGWKLINPHRLAWSPSLYQQYIKRAHAEFCCAKPIHSVLKTGWFSDRSACFLASGRPVLAEDTGLSEHLPTGRGLLCFSNIEQAVAGVAEIDANYPQHMRAARELAEEYLSSTKWLPIMLAACGY